MRISVFGTGYVGLVTSIGLASTGKNIICIDNDKEKIKSIKNNILPIYEPGLEELLIKNRERIKATTNYKYAVKESDVIIIAVGTPFDGKQIDLSYIKEVSRDIGNSIKNSDSYKVVVIKSTVIPGTTMNVVRPIVLKLSGKNEEEIGFAMNPEFLREGNAMEDFLNPDRIVLGVSSEKVEKVLRKIYDGFRDSEILVTNPTSAEMIKYTANSYLALNISFSNEIARICEKLPEVDSELIFKGVILDKRFSPIVNGKRIIPKLSSYLRAGIGFGGSCFPKDIKAFKAFSEKLKINGKLLAALLYINQTQLEHVFNFGLKNHKGKVNQIAVLGTAFKPETDDIRESPGINLIQLAINKGIKVSVHDYIALKNTKAHFGKKIKYFEDPLEAVKNADIIFVTTIWPQYKLITDEDLEKNLKENAILIDVRSLFKERKHKSWRYRIGVGM